MTKDTLKDWEKEFDEVLTPSDVCGNYEQMLEVRNKLKSFIRIAIEKAYQKGLGDDENNQFYYNRGYLDAQEKIRKQTLKEVIDILMRPSVERVDEAIAIIEKLDK